MAIASRPQKSGPAALAILQTDDAFDLLFTDVVMPDGMNGYDLAAAARTLHPHLKVLFTTGYAGGVDDLADLSADQGRRRVLLKPYGRAALAEQVRAVLDLAA